MTSVVLLRMKWCVAITCLLYYQRISVFVSVSSFSFYYDTANVYKATNKGVVCHSARLMRMRLPSRTTVALPMSMAASSADADNIGTSSGMDMMEETTKTTRTSTVSIATATDDNLPLLPVQRSKPMGLYVHIPYCRRRCRYCDFAIVPVGSGVNVAADADVQDSNMTATDSNTTTSRAVSGFLQMDQSYRAAVLEELDLVAASLYSNMNMSNTTNDKPRLQSVYFGGGTPSLAPVETLVEILERLRHHFDLQQDAEITIEMDPGTFDSQKLSQVLRAGFNRISLGVQSFNDTVLASLGRVHRSQDVYDSIAMIREAIDNNNTTITNNNNHDNNVPALLSKGFSIDLISGLPGVSLAEWATTLEQGADLGPSHMSVYDLQIEQGTTFGKWFKDGNLDDDDEEEADYDDGEEQQEEDIISATTTRVSVPSSTDLLALPSAKDSAFMYKYASGYLRARGFEHYEISSYALNIESSLDDKQNSTASNRSQHNSIYWEPRGNWLGTYSMCMML
jgi:coproporphyrinogen III oxidase-like Fe-S oxidoreductase